MVELEAFVDLTQNDPTTQDTITPVWYRDNIFAPD